MSALGDSIPPEQRAMMNDLASALDNFFNPDRVGLPGLPVPERKVGFFLTSFNFGEPEGRFNYISNAEKIDVQKMLLDIVERINRRVYDGGELTMGQRYDKMVAALKAIADSDDDAGINLAYEVLKEVGEVE